MICMCLCATKGLKSTIYYIVPIKVISQVKERRNRIMASGGERQKQENYIYVIKVCNLAPHNQSTFSVPSRVVVKVMAYRDDLSHNSWAVEDVVHIQQWVSHYR